MSKDAQRKAAAEKLRGSVLAYRDPMEPAGDWSEWSALDEDELSVAELRRKVWDEVVELFDGDEIGALDWMTRPRIPLGHAAPSEMLDRPEDIVRLRQFIQQIQRGIVP
jgi:hypothetical protein